MSHLYPNLRLHQVFGANTDVGKTIFTTALCIATNSLPIASSSPSGSTTVTESVHYLKPVSTGNLSDSDDSHVSRFSPQTHHTTIYRFSEPVSPHLAVELEKKAASSSSSPSHTSTAPTDEEFVRSIGGWIFNIPKDRPSAAYVETAGGVHSPGPNGTSQSQLLRPLRLPTILIGSSELGGISTTRASFESLSMMGYEVEAVLMFPSQRYGNVEYLRKWFAEEHGIPVFGLGGPTDGDLNGQFGPPPVRSLDTNQDRLAMIRYYQGLVEGREPQSKEEDFGGVSQVVKYLRENHKSRIQELTTLAGRTRSTCWWPFTQHNLTKSDAEVLVIDSAHGDFFTCLDQRGSSTTTTSLDPEKGTRSLLQPVLDGSASWWTQCLGHSPPRLTKAAAKAAGRYGHVLFPTGANQPSLELAETLTGKRPPGARVNPGKGWADRVFFSDDGSTGMEVGLKMAIQSSISRYSFIPTTEKAVKNSSRGRDPGSAGGRPKREWEVLGIKGSYHGDTIGAMDATEPSVYSQAVEWYRGRGFWFDPPTVKVVDGVTTISVGKGSEGFWKGLENGLVPESGSKAFLRTYDSIQSAYHVERRLEEDPLAEVYRRSIRAKLEDLVLIEGRRYGALVLEPVVMGAGGMIFVDPLFQRILVDTVRESEDLFSISDPPLKTRKAPGYERSRSSVGRDQKEWQGLPVIFDEVFTGLYRLGKVTPSSILGCNPDISCLAKILTGGLVPMSVTLASKSIFRTFSGSDKKVDALLHGHSYTAHPIGCEVANETLRALEEMEVGGEWDSCKQDWEAAREGELVREGVWSFWSKEKVEELSRYQKVESVMAMGTVLAVTLKEAEGGAGGYTSNASNEVLHKLRYGQNVVQHHPTSPVRVGSRSEQGLEFNIHARPLGNVIYFMSSLNTPREVFRSTEAILLDLLR
ncbi:PLP-dependent transferase [Violaceomyces palustris]|uniref:PLP-dependent transferase n=1 Tax=Violaceomyces palustris TaxID=1673888 RepID=A0ACD0P5H6_9BASI|nr:PLP-dependent transferase [Violaceomyces palustris]